MLFTFITEKKGATTIEQFTGKDLTEALLKWIRKSTTKPKSKATKLRWEVRGGDRPTPVSGVKGVWCFGGVDDADAVFMVHIVATRAR